MSDNDKLTVHVDFDKLPNSAKAFTEVYNLIASAAGVNPDDVKSFDCRKIDYSRNAEDLLYKKVGTEVGDTASITMALAMNGMKIDDKLPGNSAVIYRGGIVLNDGSDLLDVVNPDIQKDSALFTENDCIKDSISQVYYKRILVLKPEKMKDEYQDKKYQLWLPITDTNGCSPSARGKAIAAVCLYDGEVSTINWRRDDFIGILQDSKIPSFVVANGWYSKYMYCIEIDNAARKHLSNNNPTHEKGGKNHER